MTHHTDAERAAYERELIDNHHYVPSDFSFKDGFYGGDDDYIQFGWDLWQAARRAPAAPVPQGLFEAIEHGDEKHRAWLKAALTAFFAGKPVPREVAAAPQPPEAAPVELPEYGIDTANHAGIRVRGYTEQQVRELLANHGIQEQST